MAKKLGRGVALVGAGMSDFGAFPGKATRDLFVESFTEMRDSVDKGLNPEDIEAVYIGNYSSDLFEAQGHTAPFMTDYVGLTPRPATRCENACASSSAALRSGIMAVASGLYDMVLVGGIEKMTDLPTAEVTDTLATASDALYDVPAGYTFPGLYASIATAYMDKYGATPEAFMSVGLKNHNSGALNPKAQFGMRIADIMAGKVKSAEKRGRPAPTWANEMDFLHDDRANLVIAWPMRLFDCSPVSDGAASLLIVSEDIAKNFTDDPLYIVGSGQASDVTLRYRSDLTTLNSAKLAAQSAYEQAGVTAKDIKVAEVHDCFTIAEIVATEDLGFFKPGQGYEAAEEGVTSLRGPRPVNTSGGLKSKGHPVGASGAGQVVEVWKQMRGVAGERQLEGDINVGLTHNVGGTGESAFVHVFERR